MQCEGCERALRELQAAAAFRHVVRYEVAYEQRDVFAARAQRGHLDGEYVDAMKEVFAKRTARDGVFEIAVRSGDDADVAADRGMIADALEHSLLQDTQQLHLHGRAHVPDLVEEESAALGDLETALAGGDSAGKGALFVAEQLGFEQIGGDRAAVHRHKGAAATRTQIMDGAGDDFLAGAGFAEDECRGVEDCDLADQSDDVADDCGRTGR